MTAFSMAPRHRRDGKGKTLPLMTLIYRDPEGKPLPLMTLITLIYGDRKGKTSPLMTLITLIYGDWKKRLPQIDADEGGSEMRDRWPNSRRFERMAKANRLG
jgi:hypothetical protein